MSRDWSLAFLGESAVAIRPHAEASLEANARVHDLAARLRRASVPGVRDIVPGMRELVVHVDPLGCDPDRIERTLTSAADQSSSAASRARASIVEIAVTYGGEAGPDLEDVARSCAMSPDDVCQRHAAVEYVVCFVGFLPGFPYLGLLDPSLHLPRRRSPRPRVPAGSVAIAGEYTGVYPWESPGGWHLIGRTDVSLFDLAASPPARLQPGDRVRFVRREL